MSTPTSPAPGEGSAPTHDVSALPLESPASSSGLLGVVRNPYLLKLLVRREIQARYGNSVLGLAWSYIMPFTRFCMYLFIFQLMMSRGASMQNFAVHLFAGMVVVHYFTETFNAGTRSISANKGLVSKMAMPKETFPVASMLVSLYHTVPQLILLTVISTFLGWRPDPLELLALVMGILIVGLYGTALGLVFSALNVYFQDFGKLVMTLTMFINFMVPMMYPYEFVTERFPAWFAEHVYLANPVAEAVLLMQRGVWVGTNDNPEAVIATAFPDDLWLRGGIMIVLGFVLLWVCQKIFTKLEAKIPERLT